jgi:cytochrome b subunit of formate dehydrogenase
MELWRRADNPWGQDVLIGISWDLMWAAAGAALLFLVGHALWVRTRPKEVAVAPSEAPAGLPDRIERHSMSARVFHWTMTVAMLALLVTAFVPVIGLQFAWVQIHWIAGVLLIVSVAYHTVHAIGWQDFWAMYKLGVSEGMTSLKHIMSSRAPAPPKGGKYPFDHRLYHHAIVVVSLGAIVTGVLMMLRIDTPFWSPNPYFLSDATWGVMYVVHGLSGVSLILLIASHIYFALRPEKRWITWSMIRGWIDREHYLEHFDPAEWVVTERSVEPREGAAGALADSAVRAPRRED